jgi:hypothetical protein
MTSDQIHGLISKNLGQAPGYDAAAARQFSDHVAGALQVAPTTGNPTPAQQACYAKCQQTRDAAMVACAKLGFPAGMLCVGAAVMAFNACRHQCDKP